MTLPESLQERASWITRRLAKRYRDQADEYRVTASMMTNETSRASYMGLADAYEGLADSEDKLAFDDLDLNQAAASRSAVGDGPEMGAGSSGIPAAHGGTLLGAAL